MTPVNGFQSFYELSGMEHKRHYHITAQERGSRFLIFTPHGGGIEPGASELTRAIAGSDLSCYIFEGVLLEGNDELHITSTRFDEPKGLQMIAAADIVVTIHGCGSRRKKVFVGGLHELLVERFVSAFQAAGFQAEIGLSPISGRNPRNICNRGKAGKGVQLEFSEGLRRELFLSLDRQGRRHTTAAFAEIVTTGRSVLLDFDTG